jgi:hypothetical protein
MEKALKASRPRHETEREQLSVLGPSDPASSSSPTVDWSIPPKLPFPQVNLEPALRIT